MGLSEVTLQPLDVLVVSRSTTERKALCHFLVDRHHRVTACRNRWTAEMTLRRRTPDVVILDAGMPANDAARLVRLAQLADRIPPPTILALLTPGRSGTAQRLLSAGVDDFLRLPVDGDELDLRLLLRERRAAGEPPGRPRSHTPPTPLNLPALPGRDLLVDDLRRRVFAWEQGLAGAPAVIACGVDRLGQVNVALGHQVGDELLSSVARRVREACGSEDLVAGLDGATLVVVTETRTDVREAATLADTIRRSLERPVQAAGQEIYPGVSLGIARWSDTDVRPQDLLQDALAALHHAREPAGRRHALFDPSMRRAAAEMLQLENDLRRALQRREIEVFYQPIANLTDGGIAGFEALARWRHPQRGLLPPISFVPAAESLGLIIGIDRVVAETACRQLRSWQVRYRQTPPLTMSVNVSSTQFMQPDLVPQLDLILRSAGVWGQSVSLEVTESVLMEDAQHAAAMLAQLRRLGMGISVDDFGTGYSSLAYLRRFEIDAVKIDRSFVARMLSDDDSLEIVRSVVSLARNLGKRTVAEGVETRSQLDHLRTLGVDQIQGMFVAAPLPAEAAEELLARAAGGAPPLDGPSAASAPSPPG